MFEGDTTSGGMPMQTPGAAPADVSAANPAPAAPAMPEQPAAPQAPSAPAGEATPGAAQ